MVWYAELLISIIILGLLLFAGYMLGKTVASLKYGAKIDSLKIELDACSEELKRVREDIRKGKFDKWKK